jgi:hypothetical protein
MRLGNTSLSLLTMTVLGVALGNAADNRLRIDVSPLVSVAPAVVRIRAIVAPDASNRALQIVVDSGSYYRSSVIPLDGANAAAITETTLKNLPGGDYEVTVALIDSEGKRRTTDRRELRVTSGAPE